MGQTAEDKYIYILHIKSNTNNPSSSNLKLLELLDLTVLGDPEVTAILYCNVAYPYWEGCVICSIYLR